MTAEWLASKEPQEQQDSKEGRRERKRRSRGLDRADRADTAVRQGPSGGMRGAAQVPRVGGERQSLTTTAANTIIRAANAGLQCARHCSKLSY